LTEVEVLQALPTTLDGDALAAFYAILPDHRGTFLRAFAQMAAIFDPPSNVRHKFAARRRGETETPLTFRSTNMLVPLQLRKQLDREATAGGILLTRTKRTHAIILSASHILNGDDSKQRMPPY
ncbi:unnamed protein product, partial [Lampetra fluviatilis]